MKLYGIPINKTQFTFHSISNQSLTKSIPKSIPTSKQNWFNKLEIYAEKKWNNLSMEKKDGWKYKIYIKGNQLLNKLDHREWFLKGLASNQAKENSFNMNSNFQDEIILYKPKLIQENIIKEQLKELIEIRLPFHRQKFYLCLTTLPITLIFSILPLPNLPMFYNLYRIYSHYKALQGATILKKYMLSNEIKHFEKENIILKFNKDKNDISDKNNKLFIIEDLELIDIELNLNLNLNLEKGITYDEFALDRLEEKIPCPGLKEQVWRAIQQVKKLP